ncbi:hypothetical protein QTP88_020772 [Uroleucon formosanum]
MIDIDTLITEVEKEECLWNINSSNYMEKHYKTKAWINVASVILKNWGTLSSKEQESYGKHNINFYVSIYTSGSGANPTKKYAYADVLSFLQPVLKKRKTTGNMYSPSSPIEIETTVGAGEISEEDHVATSNNTNRMNTTEPQNKKQRNTPITPFQQNLLHLMQYPPTQTRSEDIDPDKAFLLSFLPEFKKMNDNQILDLKIHATLNANIHQLNYPNYIGQQTTLAHPSPYPYPIYTQQYNLPMRPSSRYSTPQNYSSPTSPADYSLEDIGMNHSNNIMLYNIVLIYTAAYVSEFNANAVRRENFKQLPSPKVAYVVKRTLLRSDLLRRDQIV